MIPSLLAKEKPGHPDLAGQDVRGESQLIFYFFIPYCESISTTYAQAGGSPPVGGVGAGAPPVGAGGGGGAGALVGLGCEVPTGTQWPLGA
jgi:hypothetical protein